MTENFWRKIFYINIGRPMEFSVVDRWLPKGEDVRWWFIYGCSEGCSISFPLFHYFTSTYTHAYNNYVCKLFLSFFKGSLFGLRFSILSLVLWAFGLLFELSFWAIFLEFFGLPFEVLSWDVLWFSSDLFSFEFPSWALFKAFS